MDETVYNEEHNCQLFTDLDQLKSIEDNDTSIQTNIEQGALLERHALGSACLGNGGGEKNNRMDKYAGTDRELV